MHVFGLSFYFAIVFGENLKSSHILQFCVDYHLEIHGVMVSEGLITPATSGTIRQHLSSCNNMKSGGATSIYEHNPQQFQGWNRTENLV